VDREQMPKTVNAHKKRYDAKPAQHLGGLGTSGVDQWCRG